MKRLPSALIAAALVLLGSWGMVHAASSVFNVQQGGTGKATFTASQILYGNGTNALSSTGTTTASCSGNTSCSQFTILGSSPVTISSSGGSGIGTVATSTLETKGQIPYFSSTSAYPATVASIATTSLSASTGISFGGTAGALIGGSSLTISNTGVISNSCPGGFLTCSGTNPSSFTLGTLGAANGGTGSTTLSGLLKGNGTGIVQTAVNGIDYTLITANTCSAGNHVSAITAAGVITCSADSGSGTNYWTSAAGNIYNNTGAVVQGPSFQATSTVASIFPNASTTAATVANYLSVGSSSPLGFLASNVADFWGNQANGYVGITVGNKSSGTVASADYLVNNNLSTQVGGVTTYYGDFGENGSGYAGGGFLGDPSGNYLFSSDGSFAIGTASTTNTGAVLKFGTAGNEVARFTTTGLFGIATATPWGLLSVNPTAANNSAPSFTVGSSSATRFIVTNAGLVGIGTSSPTSNFTLGVTGSGYFSTGARLDGALTYGGVTLSNAVTGTGNMVLSAAPTFTGTTAYSTLQGTNAQASGGFRGGTAAGSIANVFGTSSASPNDTGGVALKYGNAGGSTALFVTGATGLIGVSTTTPWGQFSINPIAEASALPEFVVGSSTTTHFIVNANGNVGVGTTSPYTNLSVTGGLAITSPAAFATGDSALCWRATGTVTADSGVTSCTVSSQFVKHDIKSLDSVPALDRIMRLNPVSFTYNDTGRNDMGLIAEKVSIIEPTYAQYTSEDKVLDGHHFKAGDATAINWASITADLIKTVQGIVSYQSEQDKRIAALEAEVEALQSNKQVLTCKAF